MVSPLGALVTSSFLLLIAFPDVHASINSSWKHAAHNSVGGGRKWNKLIIKNGKKHHHPKFVPGPWKQAHATFYEGGSGTFGI